MFSWDFDNIIYFIQYLGKPYPTQQFASAPPVMQHNQGPYNPSQYPPPQSGAYPPLHRGPYPMQQNPVGGAYPPAEPPPPYYVTDPYVSVFFHYFYLAVDICF